MSSLWSSEDLDRCAAYVNAAQRLIVVVGNGVEMYGIETDPSKYLEAGNGNADDLAWRTSEFYRMVSWSELQEDFVRDTYEAMLRMFVGKSTLLISTNYTGAVSSLASANPEIEVLQPHGDFDTIRFRDCGCRIPLPRMRIARAICDDVPVGGQQQFPYIHHCDPSVPSCRKSSSSCGPYYHQVDYEIALTHDEPLAAAWDRVPDEGVALASLDRLQNEPDGLAILTIGYRGGAGDDDALIGRLKALASARVPTAHVVVSRDEPEAVVANTGKYRLLSELQALGGEEIVCMVGRNAEKSKDVVRQRQKGFEAYAQLFAELGSRLG